MKFRSEITDRVKESVINTFASIIGSEPNYVEQNGQSKSLNGVIGNIAVFNQQHTLSLMIVIPERNSPQALGNIYRGGNSV